MKKILIIASLLFFTISTGSASVTECTYLPTTEHLRAGCKLSHQKSAQGFWEWLKDIFTVA